MIRLVSQFDNERTRTSLATPTCAGCCCSCCCFVNTIILAPIANKALKSAMNMIYDNENKKIAENDMKENSLSEETASEISSAESDILESSEEVFELQEFETEVVPAKVEERESDRKDDVRIAGVIGCITPVMALLIMIIVLLLWSSWFAKSVVFLVSGIVLSAISLTVRKRKMAFVVIVLILFLICCAAVFTESQIWFGVISQEIF